MGQWFTVGAFCVRDFIEMMVCAQEVMDAERDPLKTFNAFDHMITTIANMAKESRRCRNALREEPLEYVYALAIELSNELMPPKREEDEEPQEGEKSQEQDENKRVGHVSREELEVPVYKMAILMRMSLDEVLDLEFEEFLRRERIITALIADLKMELLDLLDYPHILEKGRKKVVYAINAERKGIKPKDANPWSKHMDEARQLLT